MRKAYQFRIYPNKNQEVKLNSTLSTCRHLYNDALAQRKRQAELNNLCRSFDVCLWGKPEWITYRDQQNTLPGNKTNFQKEVFSQVLQNTLKRVDTSFKNFFNGFGYPRFQGRGRYNSFTYPQAGFRIEDGRIKLSKIGAIKIIQHREIEGKIKTCTIKKDIDQWYVMLSTEIEKPILPVETKQSIGIDVGLSSLLTMSNGSQIEPPEFLRSSEKKMAKEQIRLSRKKKGSHNRKKQGKIVARTHRTIRNQRKDFAHKTSRKLVDTYDKIVFEDLQVKNMMQNHHLAKSISDAGWYQLIQLTNYKAEYAGKIVEQVNARNTSQNCSQCGNPVPKKLSVRMHSCPFCGLVMDRDHNAAINILSRSKNTAGTAEIKACPSNLSIDTMKQEAPSLRAG
ncbi:MAG: transposase [Candidatus Methanoperedens nitroreducens]|uniref:Transposase n=1 Tax=Candidatus Methanoperedens nitratireducens TaxID=1392998 RepID=A0A0P8C8U2_9EURY|nr:RNA-guided endonuclease TnpB family protein [Candidatus Methanoperedens sp. BLZ2]KAB2947263.1 MAG: IS200/IS605 family element transposase accessory protein TnpB [Candidatus Methanoperedens sp.]KPQ43240.1 MAG: transposase [Candidatus Methanoperedens sp. BLZ1]MBZ0175407.1 transposase [Candidatus Methanoperedens nitroreducens]MCX9079669.1 transposase [Candidatus Methanoperedens sp.]MCX9088360.1 transposase [Candidatus Methanoperedens sp.]